MTDPAQAIIQEAEGRSAYSKPDTRGFQTIGIGCCVDARVPGAKGLCAAAIDVQFAFDSAAARMRAAAIPGYLKLNPVQQGVLISMCFQLGYLQWPAFRAAIAKGDLAAAAAAGLDSEWARTETPVRAAWEMGMLQSGQLAPYPG